MAEVIDNNVQATEPATNEGAKYTDAQVDEIINKKFAKWKADQEKAVADAVAKVEEAHKLAQMNATEKAEHERKAMEEELASLKAEKTHNTMMSEARNMLKADGLDLPDDIITVLVTGDAETTKNAIKAFSAAFQTAVNEAVKTQLAGSEPRRGTTATGMTREQIMDIKDPTKRQKAIRDNMHLFEDMLNGGN